MLFLLLLLLLIMTFERALRWSTANNKIADCKPTHDVLGYVVTCFQRRVEADVEGVEDAAMRLVPVSLALGCVVVYAELVAGGSVAEQLALGALEPADAEYSVEGLAEVEPDQRLVALAIHLDSQQR